MTDASAHRAGQGPLTLGLVLRHASGMLRLGYLRVALVALVLFVPPAILAALVEPLADQLDEGTSVVAIVGIVAALFVTVTMRLLGEVVFAGYLDAAVGTEYFAGRHVKFDEVLRTLPWGALLVADLVIVVGAVIGLALFVVPGIVFYVLFGLVGPVIVQERRGVREGFARTFRISRTALVAVTVLVLVPLTLEHVIEESAHTAVEDGGLELRVLTEWLLAAVIGGIVGLIEVALATELMARNPEPRPADASEPAPLPPERATAA